MPRATKRHGAPTPPTPAARVVHGAAFRVVHRPDGILSPATFALQELAKAHGSRQSATWGVFPVCGQDVVVAGYLSARTPLAREHAFAIEPGGTLATSHDVVQYECSTGGAVGDFDDEMWDGDCVDDLLASLCATEAWSSLGATRLNLRSLPGAEHLDASTDRAFLLLTDDGRAGEVAYGMSFWRPGSVYREGRVETWTRAVNDDDAVRIVGVPLGRVHARAPLAVAPTPRDERIDLRAIERETRAVLDSERPFSWYFIAGERSR
jgi:hypothetical protein